ncbi:MAG: hypothetical protein R3F60_32965 [bacterium]
MSTRDDMASAALRHVRDARGLLGGSDASLDQAWHLAGFGPECARKAAINTPALDKVLGHEAHDAELLGWLLSLDVSAHLIVRGAAPTGGWEPAHRYEPTGARGLADVEQLVEACEADTLAIVGGLWTAGRVSDTP